MVPAALQPGKTDELSACLERLRVAGFRITAPRIAVLKELIRNRTPRSFQEIHAQMEGRCDVVTVYRMLSTFAEIGLVRRLFRIPGTEVFHLELGPETFHLALKDGARFEPIDGASSPEIRLAIHRIEERLRALGWREVTHVVQFFASPPNATTRP